jgi:hypothetical protein
MKILIIMLNGLMLAWLMIMSPIMDAAAVKHATSGIQELMKAGAVDHDALLRFQEMNKNEFQGIGVQFIGRWLTRKQTHSELLIIPPGCVLMHNGLYLIGVMMKRRPNESEQTGGG